MSWSKFTFLGTVKFRVTLWFAVLFILSSFFCFLLTFVYQKRYLDARLDQTLQELSSAIRVDYLAGGRGKGVIFRKGQVLRSVNGEEALLAAFLEELDKLLTHNS